MSDLSKKQCVPCAVGAKPLQGAQLKQYLSELGNGWQVEEEKRLVKSYKFKDFKGALDFVNKVGEIAEREGHHPDILLSWGKVILTFWTHKIGGLTESDFIMAAKSDQIGGR